MKNQITYGPLDGPNQNYMPIAIHRSIVYIIIFCNFACDWIQLDFPQSHINWFWYKSVNVYAIRI